VTNALSSIEVDGEIWLKMVGFLNNHWASIKPSSEQVAIVYFFDDLSRIFDSRSFVSEREAEQFLREHGFQLYQDIPQIQSYTPEPSRQLTTRHRLEAIYSMPSNSIAGSVS